MRRQNALQQLIQEHIDRTGETMSDIAARGGLPRQTVSALMARTEYASTPHRATLDKLAKGLRLSKSTVREAAARSLIVGPQGRMAGDRQDETLRNLLETLTETELAILVDTADALVKHRPKTRAAR